VVAGAESSGGSPKVSLIIQLGRSGAWDLLHEAAPMQHDRMKWKAKKNDSFISVNTGIVLNTFH